MIVIIITCFFNISSSKLSDIKTLNAYDDFIDDRTFKYIKKTYSDIDFSSDFKMGDSSVYDNYKEKFLDLLNCKIPFEFEGTKYYIDKYIYGDYEPEKYLYYFFDMDDDNSPELCVENQVGFIYIMKYLAVSDEVILWHETSSSRTELLGSKKLWFYSETSPIKYAFHSLDANGNIEYSVWLCIEPYKLETKYLLTLPELSNNVKTQSLENDLHYYRVTKNQWDELTTDFFLAKDISKENIEKVRFTYKELFDNK